MGFAEILTVLFIALKLFGVIGWSWWLVCLPEIIACGFYALIIICTLVANAKIHRKIRKHFKR